MNILSNKHENKLQNKVHWAENLIKGLNGSPQDYRYTGIINDTRPVGSNCACGMPIRWEFVLEHKHNPNDRKVIGSTCIEHFKDISPEEYLKMATSLEDFKDRMKKAKKASEDAHRQTVIDDRLAEYLKVAEAVNERRAEFRTIRLHIPFLLYNIRIYSKCPKVYKNLLFYIRWYDKEIKKMNSILAENPTPTKYIEYVNRMSARKIVDMNTVVANPGVWYDISEADAKRIIERQENSYYYSRPIIYVRQKKFVVLDDTEFKATFTTDYHQAVQLRNDYLKNPN